MTKELAHSYTASLAQLRLKSSSSDSKCTILSGESQWKENPLQSQEDLSSNVCDPEHVLLPFWTLLFSCKMGL